MFSVSGNINAPIVVVCDVPTDEMWMREAVIEGDALRMFITEAKASGFGRGDFCFINPCPPLPEEAQYSESRETKYILSHKDEFLETLNATAPRIIVTLGKVAAKQVSAKAIKITKARGQATTYPHLTCPVLHMLSPYHVLRKPEIKDVFVSDFAMLRRVVDGDYDATATSLEQTEVAYEWRTDISDILQSVADGDIAVIAVDTEGTGLRWYMPSTECISVQITSRRGHAAVCIVDRVYYDRWLKDDWGKPGSEATIGHNQGPPLNARSLYSLKQQLRELLENPNVRKCGHNMKFDHHVIRESLGIQTAAWAYDTQLLAFNVDENMLVKSLDECVRRWVPDMAGYADQFNAETDKSFMREVPPLKFLTYGGGDSDATLRLTGVLLPLARREVGNFNCYRRIQLPFMSACMNVIEPEGMPVDEENLANLQAALDKLEEAHYKDLIAGVPAAVKRRQIELAEAKGKKAVADALKLSRPDFVRDILFSPEGFNITPRVFTKTTMRLPPDQRIPSTSAKDHLPYFDDNTWVVQFQEYTRVQKLRSTYVGRPALIIPAEGTRPAGFEDATGFWRYIHEGRIHPSFMLHRTNTGRSSSSDPNGQNLPKRSRSKNLEEVIKTFRRTFIAPPGYKVISCDLSQAELRIAAWMANELNMIRIYRTGGDIHSTTAAATMGLTIEEFNALDKSTKGFKRFLAKSINFGFLYGMWWKKYIVFAKTEYGIDVTEAEAEAFRNLFFEQFPGLATWHEDQRQFVRDYGYVDALHGSRRHLPSIYSNDRLVQQECERQAINAPVQRFASDLGVMAIGRMCRDLPLDEERPPLIPIAFIHDDVVCLAREDYVNEGMSALRFYMESSPLEEWFGITAPLPILGEPAHGPNFADQAELPEHPALIPEWYNPQADDRDVHWKGRFGRMEEHVFATVTA